MPRNVSEGKKEYIFISYSHKDQAMIERVLDIFDKNNIRYWDEKGYVKSDAWRLDAEVVV